MKRNYYKTNKVKKGMKMMAAMVLSAVLLAGCGTDIVFPSVVSGSAYVSVTLNEPAVVSSVLFTSR